MCLLVSISDRDFPHLRAKRYRAREEALDVLVIAFKRLGPVIASFLAFEGAVVQSVFVLGALVPLVVAHCTEIRALAESPAGRSGRRRESLHVIGVRPSAARRRTVFQPSARLIHSIDS